MTKNNKEKIGHFINQYLVPSFNIICITIILFIVWIAFEDFLLEWFDRTILKVLEVLNDWTLFTQIFTYLLIIPIGYLVNKYIKTRHHFHNYIRIAIILYCCIYIRYRFYNPIIYHFTELVWWIKCADVFTFSLILLLLSDIINFIPRNTKYNNSNNTNKYISDRPISTLNITNNQDFFDFQKNATIDATTIEGLNLNTSWSIGITAPWGEGKTSYMYLITKKLKEKKFIIINFNPRNSKNYTEIQEDFFNTLRNYLKPYNSNLSSLFLNYMKSLQLIDNKHIISTLLSIDTVINRNPEKEKLNDALKLLSQKVIVTIDDTDRLLADEILEIFKIIDINADFPNIIYLTAFDKKNIKKILENQFNIEDNNFLDKFFDMEFLVPLSSYTTKIEYLYKLSSEQNLINEDEKSILYNNSYILQLYLPTIRDIKRFYNLLIKDYSSKIGEVDFEDFLLLTIIKYKNYNIYIQLYERDNKLLHTINDKYVYNTNQESDFEFNDILKKLFPNSTTSPINTINNLYSEDEEVDTTKRNYRRIYYMKYIQNYFTIDIQMLTQKDMENTLFNTIDEAIIKFNIWDKENSIQEFIDYCNNFDYTAYNDKNKLKLYIEKIVYISSRYIRFNLYNKFKDLITTSSYQNHIKQYSFKDINEYKKFIIESINITFHSYYYNPIREILLLDLVKNNLNSNIINKKELLTINIEILEKYILNNNTIDKQILQLLHSCIYDFNTNRILDTKCCNIVKEQIKKSPDFYINDFVILRYESTMDDDNDITCYPYWNQIFPNKDEFRDFIMDTKLDSISHITRVRHFWEIFEKNDYKPIQFERQGNVQEIIDSNLEKPYKMFSFLKDNEHRFNKLEETRIKYKKENKDTNILTEEYNSLKKEIEKNELEISYKQNLIEKLNNAIYHHLPFKPQN